MEFLFVRIMNKKGDYKLIEKVNLDSIEDAVKHFREKNYTFTMFIDHIEDGKQWRLNPNLYR